MCMFISTPNVAMGWGCCQCCHYNGLQREQCKSCQRAPCNPLTITDKFANYREDGGITKVEVLRAGFETIADSRCLRLDLKSVEPIAEGFVPEIPAGTVFDVSVNVKYAYSAYRCWELESAVEATNAPD